MNVSCQAGEGAAAAGEAASVALESGETGAPAATGVRKMLPRCGKVGVEVAVAVATAKNRV